VTPERVLFVIHSGVFGGPHNQALRLTAPLRRLGFETTVLLPARHGDAAARLRAADVPVLELPLHRLRATPDPRVQGAFLARFPGEVRALRGVIEAGGFGVVQVGGLVNPHAAIAAHITRRAVVWQLLDTRAPRPLAQVAMRFVRPLADVVMPTGTRVLAAFPGADRLGARIVPFVPPVDTDLFRPTPELRAPARALLGVPADAPVVGTVANVYPQKGIVTLVEAFARLRAAVPQARLVIIGAESEAHRRYAEQVHASIAAAGLVVGRDVILAGARHDIERVIHALDLFALASEPRSEGIPTVLLEAMAAGLPVVATDVGGVGEVVADAATGRVVPPLDVRALATALIELMGDADRRRRFGDAGRLRAETAFSVERCAAVHAAAYRAALARRGARGGTGRPPLGRGSGSV
jgi:glycosyltransferase involved in cell wall biosynthesis